MAAARQRLRPAPQERPRHRTGEHVAAVPGSAVDRPFHQPEHVGQALVLVDDDRLGEAIQIARRVLPNDIEERVIAEIQEIDRSVPGYTTDQGRLSTNLSTEMRTGYPDI